MSKYLGLRIVNIPDSQCPDSLTSSLAVITPSMPTEDTEMKNNEILV